MASRFNQDVWINTLQYGIVAKGGGSGGGGTTTTVSQPPQQVLDAYTDVLGKAQNASNAPLQQYQNPMVAGFNQDQQSAFGTINDLQGIQQPYYNAATNLIGQSTQPLWNGVQQFSPDAVNQYQNPYTQSVINSSLASMNNQDAMQQEALKGNAISSGAFGGDRAGVASGILGGQQALARNQTIAGLNNQGYSQALQEFNQQQSSQLGANQNTAGLQQQGAFGLSNIGNQALQSGLAGASAQLQSGSLQQQLGQQILNLPYEQFQQQQAYPFQTTQYLANIALGMQPGGGTSSTTAPSPSTGSQVLGGGLGILGSLGSLFGAKKNGGAVPHYAGGGGTDFGIPDFATSYIPISQTMNHPGFGPPAPPTSPSDQSTANGGKGGAIDKDTAKGLRTGWDKISGFMKNHTGDASSGFTGSVMNNKNAGSPLSGWSGVAPEMADMIAPEAASAMLPDMAAAGGEGAALMDWLPMMMMRRGGAVPNYASGGFVLPHFDNGGASPDPMQIASLLTDVPQITGPLSQQQSPAGIPISMSPADQVEQAMHNVAPQGPLPPPQPAGGLANAAPQTDPNDPAAAQQAAMAGLANQQQVTPPASVPVPDTETKTDPWLALANAGFSMAAGTSPNAMTNIAKGALAGLENLSSQKKEAAAEAWKQTDLKLKNRTIDEQANHLVEEAKHWNMQFQQAENQQKNMREHYMREDSRLQGIADQGKVVNIGGRPFNTATKTFIDDTTQQPDPMDAQGLPLQGEDYFNQLSPRDQRLTHAYATGNAPWPTGRAAIDSKYTNEQGTGILDKTLRAFPEASGNTAPYIRAFQNGPDGRAVTSGNATVRHLATFDRLVDVLGNTSSPAWNAAANAFKKQTGSDAPTNLEAAKAILGDEIANSVLGKSGALGDREGIKETIKNIGSTDQLKGAVKTYTELMGGQLDARRLKYEAATGRKDFERYLFPEARAAMQAAAAQGLPQSGGNAAGERIKITTPDGKPGTVDAAHLDELLKAGGKRR